MKRTLILVAILSFTAGTIMASSNIVFAQQNTIPSWVKNTALWWGQGQISDAEYIKSIQWLIDNKFLNIPQSNNYQSSDQATSQDATTNQGILNVLDTCTKATSDAQLKKCIDWAKMQKQLCDQGGNQQYSACSDPRLAQFAQMSAMSPFTNTTCTKDEFGIVKMTGEFTNDGTAHSMISLKLGLLDANGNVVATGVGFISNIKPFETKIFDASAVYSGNYATCQIQLDYELP